MARRLLRDITSQSFPLLKIDLSSYFFGGRTAYLGMIKTISLNLDFIVDGNQSINDIASEFVVRILENNK